MGATGSGQTRLLVLRGNSGSGKSATAHALRQRISGKLALVEQDQLRRVVLREDGVTQAATRGLLDVTVRYALDQGYDVLLEGILDAARYGDVLHGLQQDQRGETHFYLFQLSFEDTVRRHATRPKSERFDAGDMRSWYRAEDPLGFTAEQEIGEVSTLEETVDVLAQIFRGPAATPSSARPDENPKGR